MNWWLQSYSERFYNRKNNINDQNAPITTSTTTAMSTSTITTAKTATTATTTQTASSAKTTQTASATKTTKTTDTVKVTNTAKTTDTIKVTNTLITRPCETEMVKYLKCLLDCGVSRDEACKDLKNSYEKCVKKC